MKRFLILLFLILIFPLTLTAANIDVADTGTIDMATADTELFPLIAEQHEITRTMTKAFKRIAHWENQGTSPLNEDKGFTPWQSFEGGKARLVSCSADVPPNGILFLGVQVILNPDVILKKPVIQTSFAAQETKILYPLQHPLPIGQSKTEFYQDTVFFPLIFKLNDTKQPVSVPVDIKLPLVEKGMYDLSFQLDLQPTDFSFTTTICAALTESLQKVPIPANSHVSGTVIQSDSGQIILSLIFNEQPTSISVQLDNDMTITPIRTQIFKKQILLTFQTEQKIEPNTVLNFKIITPENWFDLPLTLSKQPIQHLNQATYFPILSLILLLFFAPFRFTLKSIKKITRPHKLLFAGTTFILYTTLCFTQMMYTPLNLIYPNPIFYLAIALLIILFIWKLKTSLIFAGLLSLLIPTLFLDWASLLKTTLTNQIIVVILTGVILIIPLFIAQQPQKKKKRQKYPFMPYLPMIILGVLFLYNALIIVLNERQPVYVKPAEKGYSLIIYDKSNGFQNLWRNYVVFPFNPYPRWKQENYLTVYRGKLTDKTYRQITFPTYILTDSNGREYLNLSYPITGVNLKNIIQKAIR